MTNKLGSDYEPVAPWHVDVIRTLAKDRGWSKQKALSIRGQVLYLRTFAAREEYLKMIIRRGV